MRFTKFIGFAVLFLPLTLPVALHGQDKPPEKGPNPPLPMAQTVPILPSVPMVGNLFASPIPVPVPANEILVIEMHILSVDLPRLKEHRQDFPELMGKDELEKGQNPLIVSEIDSAKVEGLVRKLLDEKVATTVSRPTLAIHSGVQGQIEVSSEGTKKRIAIRPTLNKEKTMVQMETRIEVQTNNDRTSIPSIRTQFVDFAIELKLGSACLIQNEQYWSMNGRKDEQKRELMMLRVGQPPAMGTADSPGVRNEFQPEEAASLQAIHQELKQIHKDVDRLIQLLESRK